MRSEGGQGGGGAGFVRGRRGALAFGWRSALETGGVGRDVEAGGNGAGSGTEVVLTCAGVDEGMSSSLSHDEDDEERIGDDKVP